MVTVYDKITWIYEGRRNPRAVGVTCELPHYIIVRRVARGCRSKRVLLF